MASDTEKRVRLKVVDLNPHLSCILCGGYFIDATTITECLHSFCRACIVRYLETSKYCPVCEVQVHKTRPLRCIRSDKMLQDIVYKLVPGLYHNEMMRRRELYASQPPEALKESRDEEDRGEGLENRYLYTSDELFCIALTYTSNDPSTGGEKAEEERKNVPQLRYLRCPAAMKVNHLKKFIRVKYAIPKSLQVVVQFEEEILDDDYSLIDVAYISSWKRNGPIQLVFRVTEKSKVMPKPSPPIPDPVPDAEKSDDLAAPDESLDAKVPCDEEHLEKETSAESNVCDSVAAAGSTEPVPSADEGKNPEETLVKPPSSTEEKASTETPESPKIEEKDGKAQSADKSSRESREPVAKNSASSKADREETVPRAETPKPEPKDLDEPPPPKVPKLTIPLTPKILQMAAQHAEDDRMELDSELFEGRLIIAEPELSPKESEDDLPISKDRGKSIPAGDFEESKKDAEMLDDDVDSGRGSDSSVRAEAGSLFGDDEVDSPESIMIRTPDLEKPNSFGLASPTSVASPVKNGLASPTSVASPAKNGLASPTSVASPAKNGLASTTSVASPAKNGVASPTSVANPVKNGLASPTSVPSAVKNSNMDKNKVNEELPKAGGTAPPTAKDDFGVLDLSMCHRKRGEDRLPVCRPKQVANPPVLDKYRQTTPCLPLPDHPSFKNMFPSVLTHPSLYKKPDYSRGNFRFNRGSMLTVINPDPNSCRPKIVIKNLDPRPEHRHHNHHNHHHHHHHHSHHHQKM